MKLVHIITSLEKGGAEEMLRRLLKTNSEDKPKNTLIISLTGEIKNDEELRQCGYELISLKISGISSLLKGVIKLYYTILKFKPDVIQTWLYHSDLIGGIVGRLAFVPVVVWNIRCEALSLERAGPRTMTIFYLCKFFSYVIPTKIISVGENAKKTHIEAGFCKSKITVILNGYEIEKFIFSDINRQKYRKELQVIDSEILIGCIGRYHPDKGQDVLIQAALEILKNTQNLKFIFIGRGCSYENPEIRKFNIDTNFKDKILMVGEKKNVAEILSAFDLYCMPSRTEGFPNSLAEAMLTELPCIATDVGDTSHLAGGVLTLIKPNRPDLFVTEVNEFLKLNNQEKILLGKKAREQVVNNFSIENARENFNSLYRKLLER